MSHSTQNETNIEFVERIMTSAPTGAMMQAFVIEAIRRYADQCVAAPEGHFESGFMTDEIWRGSARYAKQELEKRHG